MRDLIIAPIIVALCLIALRRPWIGVLGWTWISLMNPHALSWHLSSLPVAAAMAGTTLLGALFTRDPRSFRISAEMWVLIAFMCWMTITLTLAFDFDDSFTMWKRVMKIDFMVLVTIVLLHTRRQLVAFIWVVAASVGFYGIKGGLFTLATAGSYRVWGPTGTYIEGNNELALALVIVTPLLRFLQLQTRSKWIRYGLTAAMLLCVAAALGSHSRGALLAIGAMAMALWWFGGRQIGILLSIIAAAAAAYFFMPEEWFSRMHTISEYQDDGSAMGRINAWTMTWNLARDRFFGGGFEIYNATLYALYAPNPDSVLVAHSIYFQVLGEHGFVGLALFLALWILVWWQAGKLRKSGRARPETRWVAELGAMCQVSLIGYAVGGAFLSLAYFDLPYNLLIMVVLARRWVQSEGWSKEAASPPATAPGGST